MLSRELLYDLNTRRCVKGLIDVLEQLPCRAAVRRGLVFHDGATDLLVLWTIIRWERTFPMNVVEQLDIDIWAMTCELDELLGKRQTDTTDGAHELTQSHLQTNLKWYLLPLLDRAVQVAETMQHPYVGIEHVILAIIARARGDKNDTALHSLLSRHGLTYARLHEAVVEALKEVTFAEVADSTPAPRASRPFGAAWDSLAIGVPRQFGVGIMMIMMTMYAVLFAGLQMLGAPPAVFAGVAVLVTGVGLGQMLMYGGEYPRAASIWVGTVLFPIEVLVAIIWLSYTGVDPADLSSLKALLLISPLLGAGFGYLSGGLTAGVFLVLEAYEKRKKERLASQEQAELEEFEAET